MMKKVKILLITTLLIFSKSVLATTTLESRETFSLQIVGGINYASFINKDSYWKSNYKFGLLGKYYLTEKINLNTMISFLRSSTNVKDLKGKLYSDKYIYRFYYDQNVEISFAELLLFTNYQIYKINGIKFEYGLGLGYSFARKDYSKSVNERFTDEIIEYLPYGAPPILPGYSESFSQRNSGLIYCSDLSINYKRFHFIFLYSFHKTKIKNIGNLNSISIIMGFKL